MAKILRKNGRLLRVMRTVIAGELVITAGFHPTLPAVNISCMSK
ncbi:MAG: hypothetical protein ACYC5X_08800 [Syntrophales bacterium]